MMSESLLSAVGLFIFGSLAGFFRKVAFQVQGPGQDGHVHNFEKPWFTTLQTTIGCVLSLTVYQISVVWGARKLRRRTTSEDADDDSHPHVKGRETEYLIGADGKYDDGPSQRRRITVLEYKQGRSSSFSRQGSEDHIHDHGVVTWIKLKKLLLPSLLYQLGVVTQGVGLRYTSASVNQILSGSGIVFTAVFSFWFLKRTLNWRHWTGLAVSCVGIGIVSTAEIFIPAKLNESLKPGRFWVDEVVDVKASKVAFGVYMTVFSQVVSAAQMVWEEAYLSDLRLHPLQVMGWEGMWGLGMDLAFLMPLAHLLPGPDYGNHEENSADTAIMLTHSSLVASVAFLFLITVAGTSQIGIIVSQRLGSVFRAILLTARTSLIWVLDLLVFYCHLGPTGIGEAWTAASPWQGAGFVLLLLGTCIYALEPKVKMPSAPSKALPPSEQDPRDNPKPHMSGYQPLLRPEDPHR